MNRRILASLLVIGLVAAGLSSTTLAVFNDSEVSTDNKFAAGTLDLQVDWEESYNGEHVETQELTNDPGTIFDFEDLKPGDYGEATVSLHLEDNPGWVWMSMNQTSNWDNECTEPEHKAEGQCGSEGELGEHLKFTIWADDGDNVLQDDEHVIFNGTAHELAEQTDTSEGLLLDGNPETEEVEAFPGQETRYVGIKWEIPLETGNEIQGDSKEFDIGFYTEQERHNPQTPDTPDEPEEPEEPEPVEYNATNWQLDLVEGEALEDLSEESYSDRGDLERFGHGFTNGTGPVLAGDTGHNDQVECIDNSSQFEVAGNATDAYGSVEFDVADNESCEDVEITHVSYENTGDLGWSGGDNQELFDYSSVEVESGEEYELEVDLPSAEAVSQ